jgi:hypothetical protein
VEDSDEEFAEPEPVLSLTDLTRAMIASHDEYETVRERFAEEKKRRQKEESERKKALINQVRRENRRSELLSTAFPSLSDTESSVDSPSLASPPKRRFSAAVVTGIYTDFMVQQAKQSGDLARELKESIKRSEEATAEYRERKLRLTEEYRSRKLALLSRDKENVHPNAAGQE